MTSLVNHQQQSSGSRDFSLLLMRNIYLFSTSSHPDAVSINSLEITLFKPEIDFSKYDSLIVTSKQALIALKQYDFDDFHTKKLLCISKVTASTAKQAIISHLSSKNTQNQKNGSI